MRAWARERFPARNAIFFAMFYMTALLIGRAAETDGPIELVARDFLGFVALWCFFLMLRVFDEHKDFEADAIAHPRRVLQRGLITLRDLRWLGLRAFVIQLVISVTMDRGLGPVTMWWAAALGWSLLMAREFFVRDWLRRHIVVYALTHMLVMPLVAMWVASMGAPRASGSPVVWAFAALSMLAGLGFEIARKMRAPEQEHPMADSYTQSLGVTRASALLVVVTVATVAAAVGLTVLVTQRIGIVGIIALVATLAFAVAAVSRFRDAPTPASANRSELAVGVATLATHIVVIAALVASHGVLLR
jgi:4-hydroxybenzoate polyprenyltransferase